MIKKNVGPVSGRIVDKSGAPIPNASIIIKGTKNTTVADADGNFTIKVNRGAMLTVSAQPFFNNGALSFFGVYPVFTVNADNSVTVTNLPDGGMAPSVSDPGYKNRYDPATKTFYISYSYNAAAPRIIYDTCTFLQPR